MNSILYAVGISTILVATPVIGFSQGVGGNFEILKSCLELEHSIGDTLFEVSKQQDRRIKDGHERIKMQIKLLDIAGGAKTKLLLGDPNDVSSARHYSVELYLVYSACPERIASKCLSDEEALINKGRELAKRVLSACKNDYEEVN